MVDHLFRRPEPKFECKDSKISQITMINRINDFIIKIRKALKMSAFRQNDLSSFIIG